MAADGKKQSKFELVIGAVNNLSAPFAKINDAITRNTAGFRRLQGAVSSLNRESGLSRFVSRARDAAGSVRAVGAEGRNFLATLSGAVGRASLVLGGASGGFLALAKSTASAGDEAGRAAARAGVGLKTWQEYAHAADLSGVSNEDISKSFLVLQDTAIKAFKGDKGAVGALQGMNIAFKNAKGEVRNADNLFRDLADRVKSLNAAGQNAKAVNLVKNLLGEEGVKLMPMLAAGADGIADLRREAHALGIVLSDEDVAASKEFNRSFATMRAALRGLGFTIGRELMPFITQISGQTLEWVKANRGLIQEGVADFMARLRENLPAIITGFAGVVSGVAAFTETANAMAQSVGGWDNVLKGLAALLGGKLFLALGLAAKAFIMFGVAMLTTPIGLIAAGIAAVAGGAALIYKNWGGIAQWFSELWESILGGIRRFADKLPDFLKKRLGLGSLATPAQPSGYAPGQPGGSGPAYAGGDGVDDNWPSDAYGGYPPAAEGVGESLRAERIARQVSETRSTSVERQEVQVQLIAPEGYGMRAAGGAAGAVRQTYNGMELGFQGD